MLRDLTLSRAAKKARIHLRACTESVDTVFGHGFAVRNPDFVIRFAKLSIRIAEDDAAEERFVGVTPSHVEGS